MGKETITGEVKINLTEDADPPAISGAAVSHSTECACGWRSSKLWAKNIEKTQTTKTIKDGSYSLQLQWVDLQGQQNRIIATPQNASPDKHAVNCTADWFQFATGSIDLSRTSKLNFKLDFLLLPCTGNVYATITEEDGTTKDIDIDGALVEHEPKCKCGWFASPHKSHASAQSDTTNENGEYKLSIMSKNPENNRHTIKCTIDGYKDAIKEEPLNINDNSIYFKLTPKAQPPDSDKPAPKDKSKHGALPHEDHSEESEEIAHACGFPNISAPGFCDRPTTNAGYCYQHAKYNKDKRVAIAGTWQMNGVQTNVPRSHWEARLLLRANGTLSWKETKGANVGARRTGTWKFDGKTLTMKYKAPQVGLVTWTTNAVSPTDMSGIYRTPQVDPKGAGWGGDWSAHKLKTPKK